MYSSLTTEVKLRPAPKVPWRIALPNAPDGPPVISDRVMKLSSWIYWTIVSIVAILIAKYILSLYSVSYGTINKFLALAVCEMMAGILLFTLRRIVLHNLPSIRRDRKAYIRAMAIHAEEVQRICEEAAMPIRDLWFPLCDYDPFASSFYGGMVYWRTGNEPNNFTSSRFWFERVAGDEKLIRFTACSYKPDLKRPGTAKFDWGQKAVIQDPVLLGN